MRMKDLSKRLIDLGYDEDSAFRIIENYMSRFTLDNLILNIEMEEAENNV